MKNEKKKKLCGGERTEWKRNFLSKVHLNIEDFDVDRLDHDASKFSPLIRSILASICTTTSSLGLSMFFIVLMKKCGSSAMTGDRKMIK